VSELTGDVPAQFESKLIPILREGVEIIKMLIFKELRTCIAARNSGSAGDAGRLAAAVINELFGARNPQQEFIAFVDEHREEIDRELARLHSAFDKLRVPLTDAMRVQFLCDSMEGVDSQHLLRQAQELHLLISDRDLPLPHTFLNLVRRLGQLHGLIQKEPHT
jgi:hypothetical protein